MTALAGTVSTYHLKCTGEETEAQELLVQGHQVGQHAHDPGACTPNTGECDLTPGLYNWPGWGWGDMVKAILMLLSAGSLGVGVR